MRPAPDRQPATSAASDARSGPSLMKGPATKKPCARPTSTPLNNGDTPVLYAGRFDKKLDTIGADVTGAENMLASAGFNTAISSARVIRAFLFSPLFLCDYFRIVQPCALASIAYKR